jgi:very-short-patch-repair endonuclease
MTPAEILFWNATRRSKLGLKIDRQRAVAISKNDSEESTPIIADFLCIESRLIIEVNPKVRNKKDIYELDEEKQKTLESQ